MVALVLGIAQDAGHPQAGCTQPCCAAAWDDPSLRHLPVALGVVGDRHTWLVEATPAIGDQLHQLTRAGSGRSLGGVLVTHAHLGHYTGLLQLGRPAANAHELPVYAAPRLVELLATQAPWRNLVEGGNIVLHPLCGPIELEPGLVVEPIQVPHRDELSETFAFAIRGPAASILFLPDIDAWDLWDRDLAAVVPGFDAALVDGTFFDDGELTHRDPREVPHPRVTDTMARLANLSPVDRARVRFVHLNHTNPALNPNSSASRAITNAGFAVARRGDRLPL